jgi:hypothetical protein
MLQLAPRTDIQCYNTIVHILRYIPSDTVSGSTRYQTETMRRGLATKKLCPLSKYASKGTKVYPD